jgi:hypothetical protein
LPFFKFFSSDNLLAIFFSLASKAEEWHWKSLAEKDVKRLS